MGNIGVLENTIIGKQSTPSREFRYGKLHGARLEGKGLRLNWRCPPAVSVLESASAYARISKTEPIHLKSVAGKYSRVHQDGGGTEP